MVCFLLLFFGKIIPPPFPAEKQKKKKKKKKTGPLFWNPGFATENYHVICKINYIQGRQVRVVWAMVIQYRKLIC